MRRAIALMCLLTLALVPVVQSSGGVISEVLIVGDELVGEGPIELNITLTGVGGASSSQVFWNATLSDLEGNLIDSDSGNLLVDDGVNYYIESTLGLAPLGISNLTVSLSGDVGTPNANQWTVFEESITRLRPLNISIGEPIFNGIFEDGNLTENLTINDGDYVEIEIPVINSGDIEWSGDINMSVEGVHENTFSINVLGDETNLVKFQYGPVQEGDLAFDFELHGDVDDYTTDNTRFAIITISPPPLPFLQMNLTRNIEPSSGSQMSWNLNVMNIGHTNFTGNISCYFDNSLLSSFGEQINSNDSVNYTISMLSKPGVLECKPELTRALGDSISSDNLIFESAIITGAGYNSPSLINGPWHVDDDIVVSILVRNEGDAEGSVALRFDNGDELHESESILLQPGSAGEVPFIFSIEDEGDHIFNWSIVSVDSVVDENLSGTVIIPIVSAQDISINLGEIKRSEDGVNIEWAIDLETGIGRDVIIEYGKILDGDRNTLISEERVLLPGVTYGEMNLGEINADQVYVKVIAVDWTIGLGSTLENQIEYPNYSPNPSIVVNPITQPRVPVAGEQVTILFTLSNNGDGGIIQSEIIATDSTNSVIGMKTVNGKQVASEDYSMVVDWPKQENVVVTLSWYVDGQVISDQILVKSELTSDESSGFELPIGGILGGLAAGMVAIFAIRIKNSPKSTIKSKQKTSETKAKSPEKIEVSCPTCDRRLRVPSDYNGSVRCPECESKFDVESKLEEIEKDTEQDATVSEVEESEPWASSDNDILGCPKCTRKLKVPYEKRPAKARCPACETIFEARAD